MREYCCPSCGHKWTVKQGRPRTVDYKWIGDLRKMNYKVKEICSITGYSMGAVAKGIKDQKAHGMRKRGQR